MARTNALWFLMIFISHADIFLIARNADTVKIQKGNPVPATEYQHFHHEYTNMSCITLQRWDGA